VDCSTKKGEEWKSKNKAKKIIVIKLKRLNKKEPKIKKKSKIHKTKNFKNSIS
jgi:hypothetical protein